MSILGQTKVSVDNILIIVLVHGVPGERTFGRLRAVLNILSNQCAQLPGHLMEEKVPARVCTVPTSNSNARMRDIHRPTPETDTNDIEQLLQHPGLRLAGFLDQSLNLLLIICILLCLILTREAVQQLSHLLRIQRRNLDLTHATFLLWNFRNAELVLDSDPSIRTAIRVLTHWQKMDENCQTAR